MLEKLKEEVFNANMLLPKYNLTTFTWGNASGVDRENNLVIIKPSGVEYENMTKHDMVVVDFDGNMVEGKLKPSSDTLTHIELYKNFRDIKGVVHTHSTYATIWAQAGMDIPALGTTHADYFYGDIPCTRKMNKEEIESNYEKETGKIIVERFEHINPNNIKAVLVNCHGPFTWGESPLKAVENSVVLEEVAKMALNSKLINSSLKSMDQTLLDKHFLRKHGKNAYYGQK